MRFHRAGTPPDRTPVRTAGVTSRAVRTALGATVLLAITAGALVSGDHSDPAGVAAGSPAGSPTVRVDPLTGPVGIDPTGPVATPSGSVPKPGTGTGTGTGAGTDAASASADPSSAVTVHGTGDFASLAVTVSQTTDLVDQVVSVSWTGGRPTLPRASSFGQNYLELMECWGDAATGPDRTQCQYGASGGDNRGGAYVGTRQLNYGTLVDPAEPIKLTPEQIKNHTNIYVPFHSVRGTVDTGSSSKSFDSSTTNEVPFAPTRTDGSGQVFFETETGEEAPGLGCGTVPDSVKVTPEEGRKCWLVIVPRGLTEVDGTLPSSNSNVLQSSPLSTSNWEHRLVVPLHFSPLGYNCPISAADLHTYGTEMAEEAMGRWAPVLCQQTGSNFRYTKIDDTLARAKVNTGDDPALDFVSDPEDPSTVAPGRSPVYAPIALSGVTIGFDIESQSFTSAPDSVKQQDGRRITKLNLTPLLVAKLLTQSYIFAVDITATDPSDPNNPDDHSGTPELVGNPYDLTSDPDFLAINPDFKTLYFPSRIPDIMVPLGQSDVARRLWAWVAADPTARAFLAGTLKDRTKVNPNYLVPTSMTLPRDDFPKSDPYCRKFLKVNDVVPTLCTLDAHPYTNDMHDAARSASRGDNLSRTVWDPTAIPPGFTKGAAEAQGLRGLLVVTDTPTAERYGLNTASLWNGRDKTGKDLFVAPTGATLTAGEAAMTTVPGTTALTLAPKARNNSTVYPLTMLTYAVTAPAVLPKAEARSYSSLIGYAVGKGQVVGFESGKLTQGYVPLPQKLRTQALAAAKSIVDLAGTGLTPTRKPTGSGSSGSGGSSSSGGSTGGGSGGDSTPTTPPTAHAVVTVAPVKPSAENVARTAATPVGPAHYLMVGLLGAGAFAALAGPLLPRLIRRRRRY